MKETSEIGRNEGGTIIFRILWGTFGDVVGDTKYRRRSKANYIIRAFFPGAKVLLISLNYPS